MIVVDASAVIDGLLGSAERPELTARLSGVKDRLAAPGLLDVEVVSVLRRYERRHELDDARAREMLDDLSCLPIIRYSAAALTDRVWELRHNLTAYDAQYVALAEALGVGLLTTDAGMADAAARRGVGVVEA